MFVGVANKRIEVVLRMATQKSGDLGLAYLFLSNSSTHMIHRTPGFTDALVDPLDSPYLFFFLSAMPYALPYTTLFPTMLSDIFARALEYPCVRQSILSIASHVADHRFKRTPERSQMLHKTSLQIIQKAIQKLQVDEGLAIAVFITCWTENLKGHHESSRNHLRGLKMILDRLQLGISDNPSTQTMHSSPLLMLIWRTAIRFDWACSMFVVESPIFPTVPEAKKFHRQWITRVSSGDGTAEWALAAFSLENLIHKASHLAAQIRTLRRSGNILDLELKVGPAVSLLEYESHIWRKLPVIQTAEAAELAAQNEFMSVLDVPRFLDYAPLQIENAFYANLLNAWRALSIYISFILDPQFGYPNHRRFTLAVEICRTLAALGEDVAHSKVSKLWALFFAGAAFGGYGVNPRETVWVVEKIDEVRQKYPFANETMRIWRQQGDIFDQLVEMRSLIKSKEALEQSG